MLTLNLGNEMYSSCLFHAPDWSVVSISFVLIGWIKIENRIFGIVRLTMNQTKSGIVRLKCSKAWNNYVEFWGTIALVDSPKGLWGPAIFSTVKG